jgi:hypothetical protein
MDKYKKISLARIFVTIAYTFGAIGMPFYGFRLFLNYLMANPVFLFNQEITNIFLDFAIGGYIFLFILWVLIALAVFGYATQEE